MGMLDRYKKKGGFVQLLNLIETTSPAKAEKFLQMIKEESPAWEEEIRKKSLTLERVSNWNSCYLMEIFPRIPGNIMGTIISGIDPQKAKIFKAALGHSERRKVEDFLKDTHSTPADIATCNMKLLTEVRSMLSQGMLKYDKVDPDLAIAENIEDILNESGLTGADVLMGSSSGAPSKASPISTAAPHSAPTSPAGSSASAEEVAMLRRKLVALNQENVQLKQNLTVMKDKLETIRKAAA